MSNVLFYHKCNDCLTPFSSTERHIDLCDCDGVVTFMGVVQGTKYVQTGTKPACDGRCTHACGPMCDCACNGANHGTGRVVKTVIKEGKVKAVDFSEEDMLRAYRYRELKNYAVGLVDGNYYVGRILDKILSLKVYERRQKELIEFIVKNKKMT